MEHESALHRSRTAASTILSAPSASISMRTGKPTWPATVIDWQDFGLPENPELAAQQIVDAFGEARRGGLVEIGCLGGSGRTGTALACMAVLAGVPATEAVAWVRASYRPQAVETTEQEAWVGWFAEWATAHPSVSGR
jgi:hypothetical protein